jgi:hypothetical protein
VKDRDVRIASRFGRIRTDERGTSYALVGGCLVFKGASALATDVGFLTMGRSQAWGESGRITPVAGVFDGNAGPAPAGSFPRYQRAE